MVVAGHPRLSRAETSVDDRGRVIPCGTMTATRLQRSFLSTSLLVAMVGGCDSGTKAEAKPDEKAAPVAAADVAKSDAVEQPVAAPEAPAADEKPAEAPEAPAADDAPSTRTAPRKTMAANAAVADKPAADDKPAAVETKVAASADEGTAAQKEGWANYAKELQRKVDAVNKACGTTLTASYDKSTYTDFDPLKDRTQSACQQAVGTLQAICATDPGKESVGKLTKATCKFSTSGTGVSLSGSQLIIKIDPEKSSIVGKSPGSYSWASAIKEVI